jgi:hypothetical protein
VAGARDENRERALTRARLEAERERLEAEGEYEAAQRAYEAALELREAWEIERLARIHELTEQRDGTRHELEAIRNEAGESAESLEKIERLERALEQIQRELGRLDDAIY